MDEQIHDRGNQQIYGDESLQQMVIASTGQRLGNMFLDLFFFFVFVVVFRIVMALSGLVDIIEGIDRMNDPPLMALIFFLIYIVPQEAFSGRTLGKLITGTKAVNEDGTKLTFGKALGRTLCRFIPLEPFSFFGWAR